MLYKLPIHKTHPEKILQMIQGLRRKTLSRFVTSQCYFVD
jgi:hypothetical protein